MSALYLEAARRPLRRAHRCGFSRQPYDARRAESAASQRSAAVAKQLARLVWRHVAEAVDLDVVHDWCAMQGYGVVEGHVLPRRPRFGMDERADGRLDAQFFAQLTRQRRLWMLAPANQAAGQTPGIFAIGMMRHQQPPRSSCASAQTPTETRFILTRNASRFSLTRECPPARGPPRRTD